MNVLILTTHANTGGITSYIVTLGQGLVKSRHKVWVISSGGDCIGRMQEMGLRHVQMDIRTKSEIHPKLWLRLPELSRFIKEEKIDVIHAHTRVTQVLGTALSKLTGCALITTCHGFFRPRWFRKSFPCWGKGVIAISKPVAEHLNKDFGVPQTKIHLITNGIDLDRFKMAQENQRQEIRRLWDMSQEPLIGIIARLSDVKGIDILIKAMPMVLEKIPSAQLMIVGQGPQEDYLRQLTKELSLTAQVHFKNTINQTQSILPAFDLFVMPSLMEGLGLSVMEAQACGIPVVASRVGGLIDLITDGKTGFLVESKDPKALAEGIVKALLNLKEAKLMAQEARLNIERHFSSSKMVHATIKVYEKYQPYADKGTGNLEQYSRR